MYNLLHWAWFFQGHTTKSGTEWPRRNRMLGCWRPPIHARVETSARRIVMARMSMGVVTVT
jgi:hypothetical protein